MTEPNVIETVSVLASRIDPPTNGDQLYRRFSKRMNRRRVRRRRIIAVATLAAAASLATVIGGVWGEPTRYASAGTPAPGKGIAAAGVYQGRPWTVSVGIDRHCDDRSQDMIGFTAPLGAPPNLKVPKPPAFRINVRARYDGRLINADCDQYPFYAATWLGFRPLINYGGGVANLTPDSRIGVFTGWTQPNVSWLRVSFGNGQTLTVKTMPIGHGISLRFFGYVADNRLNVSHLSGYDETGRYLGRIGGKN